VLKNLAIVFFLGLAYSNFVSAHEFQPADPVAVSDSHQELRQSELTASPFYPEGMPGGHLSVEALERHHVQNERYLHARSLGLGQPVVVLPVPPISQGLQYPGSYMPQGTPLHRFSGYIVCDPPRLPKESTAEKTAAASAQRVTKITSTRSLAAPGHLQPCPIYTINGELPTLKSHATTMPSRTAPPSHGER
jgi:hypothetical protein